MRRGVGVSALVLTFMAIGTLATPVAAQNRIKVVATFSVVGDLVQNIGGDRIDLATLVGPDGDTERYEPTPTDVRALVQSEIIFENGLGSEPWLDRLYRASGARAPRIRVSEALDLIHEGDEIDPHVWHDVANAIVMAGTIRNALVGIDPRNADVYSANHNAYVTRLQALDAKVTDQIATLPRERRRLVTSHDTFGYFARRYDFDIVGVGLASFFTDAQPSAQQINRLVQDIRATGVATVFVENVSDPRIMQRVANEAGVLVAPQLFTDALGGRNSPATTYIDMMTYNVNTIVTSLAR
ncbi:MAG: metal transporter substrate-binding protein [Chloroflexi bacterium]|nr:metal transporter substrate-binding protein [Chloroflexota bacterium]